jgi:hypothetical protein
VVGIKEVSQMSLLTLSYSEVFTRRLKDIFKVKCVIPSMITVKNPKESNLRERSPFFSPFIPIGALG